MWAWLVPASMVMIPTLPDFTPQMLASVNALLSWAPVVLYIGLVFGFAAFSVFMAFMMRVFLRG